MAPPLLSLKDIRLKVGGQMLFDGIELAVHENERLAIVGRNGSGKSTLMKIVAGMGEFDAGERVVRSGTTVRYLAQEPDLTGFATVRAFVEAGLTAGDDPYRAQYLLGELGLTGDEDTASLSGGEARRAALAQVLAPSPDIVLLDEPTNHLDLPAIEWLESELKSLRSALVLISHDRRFLEGLTEGIVWLDRGVTRRMSKSFAHFEAWRDAVIEEEERDRQKLDRKIAAEEDWVRYGVTARRKRNMRRMGELADLRDQRRTARRATGSVQVTLSEGETSGKLVVEAKGISKSYGGRAIVADASLRILRGDRLAIVGPNGAGKTTLLKMLTGQLAPDAGTVTLGTNLTMVSLDQRRAELPPRATLAEVLTDGRGDQVMVGGAPRHVIGYMKDFLFSPEQAFTEVRLLSGGERGRLLLARALAQPSNLLVLDEPTNDLDLETLDLLQETVADYPGTVILVSHDRDFLDRTATSVLMAEGDGRFVEYAGGYSDMVAQRGQGVEARKAAASPAATSPSVSAKGPKAAPPSRRKMSFKDQHALATLPIDIAKLSKEIEALNTEVSDPGIASDSTRLRERIARLADRQEALAKAEERWLELEMLREEIGG